MKETGKTEHALTFLLSDGGILAVSQWTGGAVTQTRQVVLITTECLGLCPAQEHTQMEMVF